MFELVSLTQMRNSPFGVAVIGPFSSLAGRDERREDGPVALERDQRLRREVDVDPALVRVGRTRAARPGWDAERRVARSHSPSPMRKKPPFLSTFSSRMSTFSNLTAPWRPWRERAGGRRRQDLCFVFQHPGEVELAARHFFASKRERDRRPEIAHRKPETVVGSHVARPFLHAFVDDGDGEPGLELPVRRDVFGVVQARIARGAVPAHEVVPEREAGWSARSEGSECYEGRGGVEGHPVLANPGFRTNVDPARRTTGPLFAPNTGASRPQEQSRGDGRLTEGSTTMGCSARWMTPLLTPSGRGKSSRSRHGGRSDANRLATGQRATEPEIANALRFDLPCSVKLNKCAPAGLDCFGAGAPNPGGPRTGLAPAGGGGAPDNK